MHVRNHPDAVLVAFVSTLDFTEVRAAAARPGGVEPADVVTHLGGMAIGTNMKEGAYAETST